MNINASLFMQCIVFLALAGFVMKYIWPPLINAIDARRTQIAEGLAAAERANLEQAQAQDSAKILLTEAKAQATDIIGNAQKRATDSIEQSKEDAKIEGKKQIAAALDQIQLERNRATESLRKDVASLSILAASKIISQEIDEKSHAKLIDELVAQL
ncbi:F0F1 ATP synthase subunit B [Gammaproteobacteria bacterium]|nr:F0F1 ATP synthase subunit B [Gammaproteobacteria bacterium]